MKCGLSAAFADTVEAYQRGFLPVLLFFPRVATVERPCI
jgi:hypothetical protein